MWWERAKQAVLDATSKLSRLCFDVLPLLIACNPREKEPWHRFPCDQGDVTVWMFGFVVENWRGEGK